jgi:hypothetical protein
MLGEDGKPQTFRLNMKHDQAIRTRPYKTSPALQVEPHKKVNELVKWRQQAGPAAGSWRRWAWRPGPGASRRWLRAGATQGYAAIISKLWQLQAPMDHRTQWMHTQWVHDPIPGDTKKLRGWIRLIMRAYHMTNNPLNPAHSPPNLRFVTNNEGGFMFSAASKLRNLAKADLVRVFDWLQAWGRGRLAGLMAALPEEDAAALAADAPQVGPQTAGSAPVGAEEDWAPAEEAAVGASNTALLPGAMPQRATEEAAVEALNPALLLGEEHAPAAEEAAGEALNPALLLGGEHAPVTEEATGPKKYALLMSSSTYWSVYDCAEIDRIPVSPKSVASMYAYNPRPNPQFRQAAKVTNHARRQNNFEVAKRLYGYENLKAFEEHEVPLVQEMIGRFYMAGADASLGLYARSRRGPGSSVLLSLQYPGRYVDRLLEANRHRHHQILLKKGSSPTKTLSLEELMEISATWVNLVCQGECNATQGAGWV